MVTTDQVSDGLAEQLTPFRALLSQPDLAFQLLDKLPYPLEVFQRDGTLVFCNRAWLDWNHVDDPGSVNGIYNLRLDPVCNDQLGMRQMLKRVFEEGLAGHISFRPPWEDLVDRQVLDERPHASGWIDAHVFPICEVGAVVFVVCVFTIQATFEAPSPASAAKAYVDEHWAERFDAQAVAAAVFLSYSSLAPLFKRDVGMTLHEYCQQVKVEHLKVALVNPRLSIAQAFEACGESSRGQFPKTFKAVTGLTPSQFRNQQMNPIDGLVR